MTTTEKRAILKATSANIERVRTPEREAEYRAWWDANHAKLTTPDADRLSLELKLSVMLAETFKAMREALAPTLDAAERWERLVATTRMAICTCGAITVSAPSLGYFSARPSDEHDWYFCGHNDEARWDGTPSDDEGRTCPECDGEGMRSYYADRESGEMAIEERCHACGGSGARP